ncbi:MAG: hypothetical protein QXJ18_01090 [Desulfurococcaceae archaeon]
MTEEESRWSKHPPPVAPRAQALAWQLAISPRYSEIRACDDTL